LRIYDFKKIIKNSNPSLKEIGRGYFGDFEYTRTLKVMGWLPPSVAFQNDETFETINLPAWPLSLEGRGRAAQGREGKGGHQIYFREEDKTLPHLFRFAVD
jgi:hypothetical protein